MNNRYTEYYTSAQMAFASGQYDNAVELCDKAIACDSTGIDAITLAGNACLVNNNFEAAEKYFRDAIILDCNTGKHYFDLANSLFGQQRLSEALESYAKAVQLGCDDEVMQKIYYIMGVINQLGDKKDYNAALINYEKADSILGTNADQTDILLKKIQIYVEQHNYEKAENCAIQLKLLLPNEFQSYQLLFQLYLEQKKIDSAEALLDEAEASLGAANNVRTELAFDRVMLYCFRAEQSQSHLQQYYGKAIELLTELEASKSLSAKDKCEAVITKAEIYMKLKNYDETFKLVGKVSELDDSELTEYIERAQYLMLNCAEFKQDYQTLKKCALRLKESDNLFYRHHGYYSEAFATKKLAEVNPVIKNKATELYNFAIAYYKNCTISTPGDFLAYLYRAKSYVDIGKYDKASEISKVLPAEAQKTLMEYIEIAKKGVN